LTFQILEIQLTDNNDPYFLHHLQINEDLFHSLKSEQNLLVDFEKFPSKFVELLENCLLSNKEETPKFVCKLISEPASDHSIFNIVETNSFKHINHLSLSFIPGDDGTIKQYLAHIVKEFKSHNLSLNSKLLQTEANLSANISANDSIISKLRYELDNMALKQQQDQSELKLSSAKCLSQEREKAMVEEDAIRRQYEMKIRELERNNECEVYFYNIR
jgi:spindle assembly abnormal protein 6